MTRTGKFITEDERKALQLAHECSGMWTGNGTPLGDPGFEAKLLCEKYGMSQEHGIDLKTGEFCKP